MVKWFWQNPMRHISASGARAYVDGHGLAFTFSNPKVEYRKPRQPIPTNLTRQVR